ncbi:hypothetical protein [Microvirga sesbaniae]|nr:hypothetical protein [Microvirga sp. HBU67692]
MLLPDELIERLRADLGGKRFGALLLSVGEEVSFHRKIRSFE